MKCVKVLSAILVACLAIDAAPVSDPQQLVNVVRTSAGSASPLTQFQVVPVDTRQFSQFTHAIRAQPTHTVQAVRTIPASQTVQQFRTIPATQTIQAVRNIPTHSVQAVRTIPASHTVHQLRNIPATQTIQAVRNFPTHTVQAVRTIPASHTVQQLRTIPATQTIQAVRNFPTHTIQAVRTVPSQTVVHAGAVPVRAAVVTQPAEAVGVAQYSFGYSVTDHQTGDSKTRQETRNGDFTSGSYSVADPDGRIRVVTYTADAINGFQAHVTYDGEEGPPAIAINAPATTQFVSNSSPNLIDVVRDAAVVSNVHSIPAAVAQRTSLFDNSVQQVQVATPVRNVQAFRTVPTVVRSNAVHAVHTSPVQAVRTFPVQAVRTVPTVVRSDAVHAVHTSPVVSRTIPTAIHQVHAVPTQSIRTVSSPTAAHTVHHSDHSTQTATVLRTASPNVIQFQDASGLRSVPVVGLGSGQFLRTVPATATHLFHA